MKYKTFVHRGQPTDLLQVLMILTGLNEEACRTVISMGGAYLGKFRCKDPQTPIKSGQEVSAYYRFPLVMNPIPFDPQWIVADNQHFLIANKPIGLATQGSRDADYNCFYELLKMGLPGYFGLHHRLDRDTSGLLLFARNKQWNKAIGSLFQEKLIQKTYLAVVQGRHNFTSKWELLDNPIMARKINHVSKQVVDRQGKPACTKVKLIAQHGDLSLLAAQPITGRTHQIRVHLAHHGVPLRGDTFYGGSGASPFLLHCCQLSWRKHQGFPGGNFRVDPPSVWKDQLPVPLLDSWNAVPFDAS